MEEVPNLSKTKQVFVPIILLFSQENLCTKKTKKHRLPFAIGVHHIQCLSDRRQDRRFMVHLYSPLSTYSI